VYHQCTTGNTQGLLTIPKQLANVNKKVAPWFMAAMSSEGDGVIYAIAVVGSCTGEAKT